MSESSKRALIFPMPESSKRALIFPMPPGESSKRVPIFDRNFVQAVLPRLGKAKMRLPTDLSLPK